MLQVASMTCDLVVIVDSDWPLFNFMPKVWMCLFLNLAESRLSCKAESTYAANILCLGAVCSHYWSSNTTLELLWGWGVWCSSEGTRGILFYQMNMCQESCAQTERQKPTRFFHLLRGCVVRSWRWDAALCCLSSFNICLVLTRSLRTFSLPLLTSVSFMCPSYLSYRLFFVHPLCCLHF